MKRALSGQVGTGVRHRLIQRARGEHPATDRGCFASCSASPRAPPGGPPTPLWSRCRRLANTGGDPPGLPPLALPRRARSRRRRRPCGGSRAGVGDVGAPPLPLAPPRAPPLPPAPPPLPTSEAVADVFQRRLGRLGRPTSPSPRSPRPLRPRRWRSISCRRRSWASLPATCPTIGSCLRDGTKRRKARAAPFAVLHHAAPSPRQGAVLGPSGVGTSRRAWSCRGLQQF